MQKISLYIPSVHSSNTVHFRVPWPDCSHSFLTMLSPNIVIHLLICVKLYQQAKNQLVSLVLSWNKVTFRVQRPDWPHFFLIMPYQKLFNQLLIFVNFYEDEMKSKNGAVSSICSGEMLDLKILQFEWLRAFWPISQDQHFSQIEDLYRYTVNNINVHYTTNSWTINEQIFL